MAIMHLTVIPLGTGSTSVGDYVADIQKALAESGFSYTLTDTGTIIEGNSRELLELAARLADMPFSKGVQRVVTHISLDDRRDKKISLGDKRTSVEERTRRQ